ncbi:MAG: phosphatidylglycerophosphatase A [Bacteroidales bacterium]|jgi:phosphatidylglycerophosphatase A|nr:phosphatidylglycerophosphatase A [Bacteroidales bacterium]MDN5350486.1 phosphatidylglycerophosphatase [Bacteroidales bacterium]
MKWHKVIATALGAGYSPFAPGTAGSLVGMGLLFFTNWLLIDMGVEQPFILFLNFVLIIGLLFLGVNSIKKLQTIWEHDASKIVIDEVVGVWIAAFALPLRWEYYLAALLLFRFFDIVKPLFIKSIDAMKGNWSIMLDDVLAGVYTSIVLQGILFFKLF